MATASRQLASTRANTLANTLTDGPADAGGIPARCHLVLTGRVQGVGMRPTVARLAREYRLAGQVANVGGEVVIDLLGPRQRIERFVATLPRRLPPLARLDAIQRSDGPAPAGEETAAFADQGFAIAPGTAGEADASLAALPPDLAPCPRCLGEMADPTDRRYRYPFINCLDCGPRISLLQALPWRREQTAMAAFALCPDCQREYEDPASRRYHAEVIACPRCGPQLALLAPGGECRARGDGALHQALAALARGEIVALKGVGGFQLLVDATHPAAVQRLRTRKGRPDKPLAVMFANLAQAGRYCRLTPAARRLLQSPAAPIVLVPARAAGSHPPLAAEVAPGTPLLGAMPPASPLHQLLLDDLGTPLVATSGNHSGEPLAARTHEALAQLADVADCFLTHDRPILRRADDPVVRLAAGRPLWLRRARGCPVTVTTGTPRATTQKETPAPWVLALGGYQKVAPALWHAGELTVLPPVGDLASPAARALLRQSITRLPLPPRGPDAIACDSHPDYPTSALARELADDYARQAPAAGRAAAPRVVAVPHHLAHVAAVLAEQPGAQPGAAPGEPLLGIAWDGTGHHPGARDATVLGSECLLLAGGRARRFASLLPFALPGGERAAREPWRCALGLLHGLLGDDLWRQARLPPVADRADTERHLLAQMLTRGTGCTPSSSAGRLFDGVAALLGLCQTTSYEAQAATALELLADPRGRRDYPLPLIPASAPTAIAARVTCDTRPGEPALADALPRWYLDWRPLLRALLADLARGVAPAQMAAALHRALARAMVAVAQRAGARRVVLGGGCLQNRLLLEMALRRLRRAGIDVQWPRQLPAGDGALAAGQAFWAAGLLQPPAPYQE